ncbi:UNVERIFIED_CONTAM: putative AC transposase [Sesamum radiatum]|uniref:AC transposase n=1 Tax=Sesamum radiatum TaxID=300843 RepID=A0AAW2NRX8_SESRA
MASMAIRMRDKFNKYWGNIDNINWFLFVAILLDPRYKLKYVSFGLATIYESDPSFVKRMTEKIDMLHLLYKQYAHSSLEHTSKDKDSIQDYILLQLDGEDDPSELLESQFAKHMEEEQCAESKSEVTRYLLDGCEKSSKDFDVLKWWKSSSSKYPILSKIAEDVLAIPVSTIALESAFSTSGRVIDAFRSSLSPKMVEALICTQDWLRASPRIDLCAIMEDIEKFEEFEQELEGSNSCSTSKGIYD